MAAPIKRNGIAVQSYTAQVNLPVTLPFPNPNPPGIPTSNNRIFHLTNPIVPGSIQIGQTVTDVLSTGAAGATTMVVGVDYTTNDVILGDKPVSTIRRPMSPGLPLTQLSRWLPGRRLATAAPRAMPRS